MHWACLVCALQRKSLPLSQCFLAFSSFHEINDWGSGCPEDKGFGFPSIWEEIGEALSCGQESRGQCALFPGRDPNPDPTRRRCVAQTPLLLCSRALLCNPGSSHCLSGTFFVFIICKAEGIFKCLATRGACPGPALWVPCARSC